MNFFKNLYQCFFPEDDRKYSYLGYTYNPFRSTVNKDLVEFFIEYVDQQARPHWCPKWFIRILHWLGNDNSVVRVKFWYLHRLHRWILSENFIYDIKIKWGTIRIYGTFNKDIEEKISEIEEVINPTLEAY